MVEQVLMYLPVMKVMCGGDLMALLLVSLADSTPLSSGDTFADLILLSGSGPEADAAEPTAGYVEPSNAFITAPDDIELEHHTHRKLGRVPLCQQFQEIVTLVTAFISSHEFAAQSRRRSQVGNSMGVSLEDVRAHIKEKVPEMKRIVFWKVF